MSFATLFPDAMDPTSGTDYLYENLSFPQIFIKVRVAQFATTRNRVANDIRSDDFSLIIRNPDWVASSI
jgi:hypothetical protein